MHLLVPVVKILKKLGSPEKFGRKRGLSFKGSDQEKCQVQYFSNFRRKAFAVFGKVDQ